MPDKTIDEIDAAVRRHHIKLDDIETDLDTRDNYPGEFYVMPLMEFSSEDLRSYLAWRALVPGGK